jgi:hypothetical protein
MHPCGTLIVQTKAEIRIAMKRSLALVDVIRAAAAPASYYYPREAGTS